MFGHNEKRERRRRELANAGLTTGQVFDVADAGMDINRGMQSGSGLGYGFATFAGLDVAISAARARPEEMGGRVAGAALAQGVGLAAWSIGSTVGRTAGAAAGGFIGGVLAGPAGVGVGATVGGAVGKWGTMIALPFMIDPYLRKIGRPINRLIGIAQHRANFGRGYQDSRQAYTMRQQSMQEMQGSLLGAMQYIGREAQLLHQ